MGSHPGREETNAAMERYRYRFKYRGSTDFSKNVRRPCVLFLFLLPLFSKKFMDIKTLTNLHE